MNPQMLVSRHAPTDEYSTSPDGGHRGVIARAGDVFPLSPPGNFVVPPSERPSGVRPWGMWFSRPAPIRAGKHEGGTNETTGHTDGSGPGEERASD
ncbi:hypothetical protein [Allosalinactinospora lopnorensis]|uniref:hypothetical protein n=1 Tax=Allosalinactinospora lopnorensis TaxID=1352348 RepID=UPI000623D82F|nr:hypothetical protein [Allosalinactinospora lopnorensis]